MSKIINETRERHSSSKLWFRSVLFRFSKVLSLHFTSTFKLRRSETEIHDSWFIRFYFFFFLRCRFFEMLALLSSSFNLFSHPSSNRSRHNRIQWVRSEKESENAHEWIGKTIFLSNKDQRSNCTHRHTHARIRPLRHIVRKLRERYFLSNA